MEGLSSLEQKMAKMFWMGGESIQHLFELTHSMRTKDKWLKAQLACDRYGDESWEMYCFVHGLPTRYPGSWLPEDDARTCGRDTCKTLKKTWQEQRDRGCQDLARDSSWSEKLDFCT